MASEITLKKDELQSLIAEAIRAAKSDNEKESMKMTIPSFHGKDEEDYELYKYKLENWLSNSEITDKKKSAMIINGLYDKALDTIKMIPLEKIYASKGYEEIIKALDSRFAKDKSNQEFMKTISFMDIKQHPEESYKEFVSRYDRSKMECEKIQDIKMSDKMHSYMIIHRSNMKEIEKKMILTHIHNIEHDKYEEAKRFINNIMESLVAQNHQDSREKENDKYEKNQQWFSKDTCKICGYNNHTTEECWWNESNKNKCFRCRKEGHLARNCKENSTEDKRKVIKEKKVYLQEIQEQEHQVANMDEIWAILDTGCTDNCIGDI